MAIVVFFLEDFFIPNSLLGRERAVECSIKVEATTEARNWKVSTASESKAESCAWPKARPARPLSPRPL